eukprot:363927-Chlamydomonas_euryale.AAC.4
MGHWSRQREQTVVVKKVELGEGLAGVILMLRPGRRQDRCDNMCYVRQVAGDRRRTRLSEPWIAAITCAT